VFGEPGPPQPRPGTNRGSGQPRRRFFPVWPLIRFHTSAWFNCAKMAQKEGEKLSIFSLFDFGFYSGDLKYSLGGFKSFTEAFKKYIHFFSL
jgi:hypothetical protein